MKVIIIGLGRMGTGLAKRLDKEGNEVTAIDRDPKAFRALQQGFKGQQIVGNALDKRILEDAAIDRVDAVVCCTNNDELNAVIARIARNLYRVPRVIARLYDARKAEIYRRLGIQVIATTIWGIDHTMELLTYDHLDTVYELGNSNVEIVRIVVPPLLVGQTVSSINLEGEIQVVAISRNNRTIMPVDGAPFEADDVVYIACETYATDRLKRMFNMD